VKRSEWRALGYYAHTPLQHFRGYLAYGHPDRFPIHDCNLIFPASLDSELKAIGLRVLAA
jgi:hypothetical protein